MVMRGFSAAVLALAAAIAVGGIALHRHEPINALWIITAAVCIYLLGYRFYAAWIATRVLIVDPSRATPAESSAVLKSQNTFGTKRSTPSLTSSKST